MSNDKLTHVELNEFMNREGFSNTEFAKLLGVTRQAVSLWRSGEREFSVTNSRLIKMFIKFPKLIREFGRY